MKKILTLQALILISFVSYSQNQQTETKKQNINRNEISFGLENYAKSTGINGGNYLFGQFHYQIFRKLAVGGKLSSDLTPNSFDDFLAHVGIRYNSPVKVDGFGRTIGLYYIRNLKGSDANYDFVGLDVSLITYYADEKLEIDFLPVTVLYSTNDNKFSLLYKFIGLKFNF